MKMAQKIETKSILSFCIFLMTVIRYYFTFELKIIPLVGPISRVIGWLIFLPLNLVGLAMSIIIIVSHFRYFLKRKLSINLILVAPMLFYGLYMTVSLFFIYFSI